MSKSESAAILQTFLTYSFIVGIFGRIQLDGTCGDALGAVQGLRGACGESIPSVKGWARTLPNGGTWRLGPAQRRHFGWTR